MGHKSHRWIAESLVVSLDLQHVALKWLCRVRGCHQAVVQYKSFRKPAATYPNRSLPEPDWFRKEV